MHQWVIPTETPSCGRGRAMSGQKEDPASFLGLLASVVVVYPMIHPQKKGVSLWIIRFYHVVSCIIYPSIFLDYVITYVSLSLHIYIHIYIYIYIHNMKNPLGSQSLFFLIFVFPVHWSMTKPPKEYLTLARLAVQLGDVLFVHAGLPRSSLGWGCWG